MGLKDRHQGQQLYVRHFFIVPVKTSMRRSLLLLRPRGAIRLGRSMAPSGSSAAARASPSRYCRAASRSLGGSGSRIDFRAFAWPQCKALQNREGTERGRPDRAGVPGRRSSRRSPSFLPAGVPAGGGVLILDGAEEVPASQNAPERRFLAPGRLPRVPSAGTGRHAHAHDGLGFDVRLDGLGSKRACVGGDGDGCVGPGGDLHGRRHGGRRSRVVEGGDSVRQRGGVGGHRSSRHCGNDRAGIGPAGDHRPRSIARAHGGHALDRRGIPMAAVVVRRGHDERGGAAHAAGRPGSGVSERGRRFERGTSDAERVYDRRQPQRGRLGRRDLQSGATGDVRLRGPFQCRGGRQGRELDERTIDRFYRVPGRAGRWRRRDGRGRLSVGRFALGQQCALPGQPRPGRGRRDVFCVAARGRAWRGQRRGRGDRCREPERLGRGVRGWGRRWEDVEPKRDEFRHGRALEGIWALRSAGSAVAPFRGSIPVGAAEPDWGEASSRVPAP